MNRHLLYNKRFNVNLEFKKGKCIDPQPDVVQKHQQLFDMIFSVNPVTGFPNGDLACYLGENTNPEIKIFIESQLLKEIPVDSGLSIPQDVLNQMNSKITDDDIAKFSRNHGETADDYAKRMSDYFERQRLENRVRKDTERLKRLMDETKNN